MVLAASEMPAFSGEAAKEVPPGNPYLVSVKKSKPWYTYDASNVVRKITEGAPG